MTSNYLWFQWALLSAAFASLTAIFAKVGLEGIDSDFATLIRTVIILFAILWFVQYTGKWTDPFALRPKTWLFLTLSGLATGASWVCYFRALKIGEAAKVAPVDKLSVVLVALFAVLFLGERPRLAGDRFGRRRRSPTRHQEINPVRPVKLEKVNAFDPRRSSHDYRARCRDTLVARLEL